MNQENKVVKISDVIQNQIPEFVLSENPNFLEFLKQYYISQEYQGSSVDIAENLVSYKNIDSFDNTNLITETTLTSSVDFFDEIINVESTNGWPKEYGLLKIDDEIITYTGITSTSFTGCIRGFSGISSLTQENNPEFLVFSQTETSEHSSGTEVQNLSNLFLKEFFKKVKYQFTPGFEELNFSPEINPQNFISKAKSFYQTKGTDEAFKILFNVLYAKDVKIIKPDDYCFTPSDDKWKVVETFVCKLVSGNPLNINGQTLYQDSFESYNIKNANGSIYAVESFISNQKTYYKVHIFAGYSNNLNPKGSIEGTFQTTPRTFVVDSVSQNSTTIPVNSTIGFPNQGILEIDGLTVTYTDKTNNQFLNCSGVTSNIVKSTEVFSDHYVFAYENNSNNVVKFKVCGSLSELTDSDISLAYDGDPIQIEQFGSTEESIFLNSLIYNLPISVYCGSAVDSLTQEIRNNKKEGFSISNGSALSKTPHYLKTGDVVDLFSTNTDTVLVENLSVTVLSKTEFSVSAPTIDSSLIGKQIVFKRRIKKSSYGNLDLTANIQDSYVDSNYYYLTSNGLPNYEINPLTFDKVFEVDSDYSLQCSGSQYFKTGDEVSVVGYTTTGQFSNEIGILVGNSYYVTKDSIIDSKIYLSQSRENVGLSSYIPFVEYNYSGQESGRISSVSLVPSSQYNRNFGSSKLFKKFPKVPNLSTTKEKTQPGNIGVFANGVELRNYKSFDKIYYGEIDSITVLNSGLGYNLLNPPQFNVYYDDTLYPNTKIIPSLKGKLINLSVVDPGFDYVETPIVKISGGNNFSVVTEVKMKSITHEVNFNATTKDTVIDTVNNKFLFDQKHRFVTGEPLVYQTYGSTPIGIGTQVSDGFLSNNSIYYAVNIGAGTSMYLAYSKNDALSESNLINLRTYGSGFQSFTSLIQKQVIDEVNILQNEGDFEYKKVSFISSDVNLQDNIINVKNHGFNTGDEVVYSWSKVPGYTFSGQAISGLQQGSYYYIVKIDDDNFKLSTTKNEITYADFTNVRLYATNFLEYSPVKVEIEGAISKNGLSEIGYSATIIPTIRGDVISAKPQKNPNVSLTTGEPYIDIFGEKDILNYEKSPQIKVVEGENASFQPIVVDGKITSVIVKSSGSGYYNSLLLYAKGDGFGAEFQPIITDGKITEVKVVNGGVGYASSTTSILVEPIGKNVKLKANLTSWTVNQIDKDVDVEDGAISGKNYSYSGNTYGVYFLNQKLRNFFNISSTQHSPIVGWAYDGCPIYGPFAYGNPDGSGGIQEMRSGYSYEDNVGSQYKLVEQYKFTNSGTLDKYNGRFCVTPEYPNGVYAYFCTFDISNYPKFPYVIGPEYNYTTIKENFDLKNNQSLNFNNLNIVKWTSPYRVKDKEYKYEYFEFLNSNKDLVVEKSSEGIIDDIDVIDAGNNYQVGDSLIFANEGTSGFGAIAKVSEIDGVGVTTITTQSLNFYNVTFISDGVTITGIASTYHGLKSNSYISISGISTNSFESIEGFRKINVPNRTYRLLNSITSASVSGVTTSIKISGSLDSFEVDSYLKITNEIVKIVGLDYINNVLNILRPSDGPGHSTVETVEYLQDKFSFSAIDFTSPHSEINQSYYFNPSESVSIGTSRSPGIGNTLTILPFASGNSYTKYVYTGGIYLPNNKFKSGDKVSYTVNGSPIVSNYGNLNGFSELYVIKLDTDVVGLVTSKSHITNTDNILTYTSSGLGDLHKFTTERNVITGTITSNECTVSTAATHGLVQGDIIKLNVVSGLTTTFTVSYSNTRVLINSQPNPKITVFGNEKVIFDLSSGTLSGRVFKLYSDENFLNEYVGNTINGIEIERTSTQLILNITDNTPKNLFYNLSDSIIDRTIQNYNQISINDSYYNSESVVLSSTNNNFKISLESTPERSSYTTTSSIDYKVLTKGAFGPISKVKIYSKGSEYKKLPEVSSIQSLIGNGANLIPSSYTIGKIEKIKVSNTEFICPSDKTLRPSSNGFSVLELTNNYTVDSLEVISGGKNYLQEPKIKLYNSKNDSIISNFSAIANLKNNSIENVTLLNPGNGLSSGDNQVVVIDNTNGFKIINVSNTVSPPYIVTLTLKTPTSGFSTSNPFPIESGDKIFVEGIKYDGNGFNSSDYSYNLFTVTNVNPAYGSEDAATVSYTLDVNPGSFNSSETYNAYVTPEDYLPKINANLKKNIFYSNETIKDTQIIDNQKNSPLTSILKVKNSENLNLEETISGSSSKSSGKISKIKKFTTQFNSNSSVSATLGGYENRGYLSSNIQKLSDNDYYQKFSYSLKSEKQFSDWNSPVSDTSHIAGYKKFSDLSVESVGIGTTESIKSDSSSSINLILNSYANVNSISDYDLVNEIDIEDNDYEYTEYLKFKRLKLGNSIKSTHNRVLSIDDISNLFNTERVSPKIEIDDNLFIDSTTLKYQFYLTSSSSFLGDLVYPEIFELLVTTDGNNANITDYSYYYSGSNPLLGSFSIEESPQDPNQQTLYFTPRNPFITVDIKTIKDSCLSSVGIATTSFGYTKNVEICNEYSGTSPQVFYTVPSSDCKSGTLIVGISSTPSTVEQSYEMSFVNISGNDILTSVYAQNVLSNIGSIDISKNGSNIEFIYTGITGIGVTLRTNLRLLTNTYAGYDSVTKTISKFSSSKVITNSSSTGITTVSAIYGYTKYIMEVEQDTGISTQRSVVQLNSIHSGDYLNTIVYDLNGTVDMNDLVFETDYNLIGNTYTLYFKPITSANYKIVIYESSLLSAI